MEEERRSEEERYHLWSPFQFCKEALESFLKCLGLYTSPSNSSASSVQEDAVTTRGILIGSKKRPREPHSSGKPGGHN
ncbi:hypothetical protein Bca4012_047629 [Brassica carinata]|uniref:BnaC02g00590D protein n=2 Tax=Brassica TaxID=3705 RepID=A0A078HQZ4_BRANA|nr:BnaC02g00590D [Brassica napus]